MPIPWEIIIVKLGVAIKKSSGIYRVLEVNKLA